MSTFKETIKGRMISTNNKNYSSLEKIGQIVDKTPDQENSFSVLVIGSDGVKTVHDNICVRQNALDNTLKKEPEIGEYVYLKEDFGRFVIIGIYEEYQSRVLENDIYTSTYNGASGGELY